MGARLSVAGPHTSMAPQGRRSLRKSRVSSRVIADFASWHEMAAAFGDRSSRLGPSQSGGLVPSQSGGTNTTENSNHGSVPVQQAPETSRLSVTGSVVVGPSPSGEWGEQLPQSLSTGSRGHSADGEDGPPGLLHLPSSLSSRRFSSATAASGYGYGASVYDMYLGPDVGTADEPSPSVPRIPSLYRQGAHNTAVEITERADGSVVWQVVANLGTAADDGASMYSDTSLNAPQSPQSRRSISSLRDAMPWRQSVTRNSLVDARHASRDLARHAWEEAERTRKFLTNWTPAVQKEDQQSSSLSMEPPPSTAPPSEPTAPSAPTETETPTGLTRILYSDDTDLIAMLEQFAHGKDAGHFDIQPAVPRPPSLRLPSEHDVASDADTTRDHVGDMTGTSAASGLLTIGGEDDVGNVSPAESDAFRYAYASSPQTDRRISPQPSPLKSSPLALDHRDPDSFQSGQLKVSPTPSAQHDEARRKVEEEIYWLLAGSGSAAAASEPYARERQHLLPPTSQ